MDIVSYMMGKQNGSGSGLPDPAELNDGTALISVNGEWAEQDGYGFKQNMSIISKPNLQVKYDNITYNYFAIINDDFVIEMPDADACHLHIKATSTNSQYNFDKDITLNKDENNNYSGQVSPGSIYYDNSIGQLSYSPSMPTSFTFTTFEISNFDFTATQFIQIDKKYIPNAVPDYSSLDNGKVLKIKNGKLSFSEELPIYANAGSGLIYDGTGWIAQEGYGYSFGTFAISGEIFSSPTLLSPGVKIDYMQAPTCYVSIYEGFTYRPLYNGDITWGPAGSWNTRIVTVQDSDERTWTFSVNPAVGTNQYNKISVTVDNLPQLGAYVNFSNVSSFAEPTYIPFNKNYIPDAVPNYTAADNGKVLKVKNGNLAFDNELPSVTSTDVVGLISVDGEWGVSNGYGYIKYSSPNIHLNVDTTTYKSGTNIVTYSPSAQYTYSIFNGDIFLGDATVVPGSDGSFNSLSYSENNLTITVSYSYFNLEMRANWSITGSRATEITNLVIKESTKTVRQFDKSLIPNELPSYTSADEGKVLKIVDGAPTWVSLTEYQGGSY